MVRSARTDRRRARDGLTLAECLTAIGVFAAVAALSMRLYVTTYQGLERQQSQLQALGGRQDLMASLRRDVRMASAAQVASPNQLVLRLPAFASGAATAGELVEYRATGRRVVRTARPAGERNQETSPQEFELVGEQARFACAAPRLVKVAFVSSHGAEPRGGLALHLRN